MLWLIFKLSSMLFKPNSLYWQWLFMMQPLLYLYIFISQVFTLAVDLLLIVVNDFSLFASSTFWFATKVENKLQSKVQTTSSTNQKWTQLLQTFDIISFNFRLWNAFRNVSENRRCIQDCMYFCHRFITQVLSRFKTR